MLVQRKLSTILELAQEYKLSVNMMQNLADKMCAASLDTMTPSQIMEVHQCCGHPGVQCTIYFVRRVVSLTKAMVKSAIATYVESTTIDAGTAHWKKNRIGVNSTCNSLAWISLTTATVIT